MKMKAVNRHVIAGAKIIVFLLLFFAAFSYGMFQGGFVSWFLFFSILPFALYALFILFYPVQKIQVMREIAKTDVSEGETVRMKMTVRFPFRSPLFFLTLSDEMPEKLAKRGRTPYKTLLFAFFKKELAVQYTIPNITRGEYEFPAVRVYVADWFGFVEKSRRIPCEASFLVYPAVVDMVYRPFENYFDQGMAAVRDQVKRDSTMAVQLRDYQPGDRFSWIHWKATARRNELMTKEFEQRQTNDLMIVLDCSPSGTFDLAVKFTASLIRAVIKKGGQAGLYACEKERHYFPVQGGVFHKQAMFYFLAKVEDESAIPWHKQIENDPVIFLQNINKIFVTTALREEDIEAIAKNVSPRGAKLLVCVKGNDEQISPGDTKLMNLAKSRGIFVKILREENFANAFGGGMDR